MSAALELYAQLTEAPDEKTRARLIADAFDALEARFPHISDLATQGHVRESELRLQKEIKEVEARLQEQIKGVELQIREVEARLQEQIKGVELQIREVEARMTEMEGRLRTELKQVEVNLHQAMAAQTRWLLGGLAVLGAVFKLADLLIAP
jgi:chromosome segregation ATPase